MSKKKSSTTTMSLKDFHGGSIPSDLILPSAPGSSSSSSARIPDRWGPSQIRPDPVHRARPGSAGSTASAGSHHLLDERGPPLLSTNNIGRNFDEEERKPFDASSSFPRRLPLSDPAPRSSAPVTAPSRPDPKPQTPQVRSAVGPAPPNAWGPKKEEVKLLRDPMVNSMLVEDLSVRFAQASAIEKVSSGRWQSKLVVSNGEATRVPEMVRASEEAKEIRPGLNEGKLLEPKEVGERPKLKLLPRTKGVGANGFGVIHEKQDHQSTINSVHLENPRELQGSVNVLRPRSAGEDVGSRVSERPRLNLKPRSLPVEESVESFDERKSVFGGARPRELVLKERGIDDVAAHLEVTSPANKNKCDTLKADTKLKRDPPTLAARHAESSASFPSEKRSGRDLDRKDIRSDHDKTDTRRATWRNDNQKNTRETEKPTERCPEPDTWRKPIEPPKSESPNGPRAGKAASPLELAQAFSRSGSDVRSNRVQVSFSRLMNTGDFYVGPNPRQINGY